MASRTQRNVEEEEVRNSEPVALFSFAVLSCSQKLEILVCEEVLKFWKSQVHPEVMALCI